MHKHMSAHGDYDHMCGAGVEAEEDLIEKYNLQDIDVLKVGHHGSKTSAGKEFIDEINPNKDKLKIETCKP